MTALPVALAVAGAWLGAAVGALIAWCRFQARREALEAQLGQIDAELDPEYADLFDSLDLDEAAHRRIKRGEQ